MKLNYFLFSLLLISFTGLAQNFRWGNAFGGNSVERGGRVISDKYGNVYTIGGFRGTVDFDHGPGIFTLTAAAPYDVPFILKYDAGGNFLWVKKIEGDGFSVIYDIAVSDSSELFMTGSYNKTVDFDPSAGSYSLTAPGYIAAFILKFDSAGSFKWCRSIGGVNATCGANDITLTKNYMLVGGIFTGTLGAVDFNPGAGTDLRQSTGIGAGFILKLDLSANYKWVSTFQGANKGNVDVKSITCDSVGSVYGCGYFLDTVDFDPSIGISQLFSKGREDIYVVKLDSNGLFTWVKGVGGTKTDVPVQLAADKLFNIYVVGFYQLTVDFDPDISTDLKTSTGLGDIFLLKLSSGGSHIWSRTWGGPAEDRGHSVSVDPAGNIYTTGHFRNSVDFDPGNPVNFLSASGSAAIFISKFTGSGNLISAKTLQGDSNSFSNGHHVSCDKAGFVYLTGEFASSVDLNPDYSIKTVSTSPKFASDIFVIKLGECDSLVVSPSATLCFGETTTLSATSVHSYTWAPGGQSSASILIQPAASIIYTVNGIVAADCQLTKTIQITVEACTGINTNAIVSSFKLYPNPNKGNFIILGNVGEQFELWNALGEYLNTFECSHSGEYSVQLNVAPGMYFLKGANQTQKVIISE